MTKAEFISKTLQIMNEVGWDEVSANAFFGSDVSKVEKHIEESFRDAWRKAVNVLPKYYFEVSDFSNSDFFADTSTGIGYIVLPDDYYTLYNLKMKGWQKWIETTFVHTDSIAALQANEYTRGSYVRPVCIVDKKSMVTDNGIEIRNILEYYSVKKGIEHEIETALYIPMIDELSGNPIVNEKLLTPLAYICAGMVFNIYEKYDIANALEQKAVEMVK